MSSRKFQKKPEEGGGAGGDDMAADEEVTLGQGGEGEGSDGEFE